MTISFPLSFISLLFNQFSTFNPYSTLSLFFVIIIFLPTGFALYKWLGVQHTFFFLLGFGFLFIAVEAIATITGYPYGTFSYSDMLGYKIAGIVPWSLPFSYFPILLGSATLAYKIFGKTIFKFVLGTVLMNISIDLVVDPAAVAFGFWSWNRSGVYYGVPAINFLGWILTSFLYASLLYYIVFRCWEKTGPSMDLTCSLFLSLSFFTGYLVWKTILIPAFLGCFFLGFLIYSYIVVKKRSQS